MMEPGAGWGTYPWFVPGQNLSFLLPVGNIFYRLEISFTGWKHLLQVGNINDQNFVQTGAVTFPLYRDILLDLFEKTKNYGDWHN